MKFIINFFFSNYQHYMTIIARNRIVEREILENFKLKGLHKSWTKVHKCGLWIGTPIALLIISTSIEFSIMYRLAHVILQYLMHVVEQNIGYNTIIQFVIFVYTSHNTTCVYVICKFFNK